MHKCVLTGDNCRIFVFIMKKEYKVYSLNNSIRLVIQPVHSPITHLGLFIDAGSRDEAAGEHGMAHFIEHIIFKGTRKRKAHHVLSCLENVGGEMNAFTGKEDTCLYASFLGAHLDRAAELFSDILFHSVYPAAEIRKEKDVVIDEINYYRDIPDDSIFEDFEAQIFREHPMGRSVLGTPDSVRKINAAAIRNFIARNYSSGRILICITGNVNPDNAFKIISKYFEASLPFNSITKRKPPAHYTPTTLIIEKDVSQAHCVTGIPACSQKDPRRLVLALLNNYLGGPGMNSRLNMSVREKHGLAYNIESNFAPFSDCGIFSIYFGADNGDTERAMRLIMREINNLRTGRLGTLQLHRAKQQIKGQLAISLESNLNSMLGAGKSMMAYDQIDSIVDVCEKIDRITATQVMDVAQAILDPLRFSTVIYQPRSNDT